MSQKVEVKAFIKSQLALRGENITSLARKMGRSQSSMSARLKENNIPIGVLVDIMSILGEDLTIVLKDGSKVTLKV